MTNSQNFSVHAAGNPEDRGHPEGSHNLKGHLFCSGAKPLAQEPTTRHMPSGLLAPLICRTMGLQCPWKPGWAVRTVVIAVHQTREGPLLC